MSLEKVGFLIFPPHNPGNPFMACGLSARPPIKALSRCGRQEDPDVNSGRFAEVGLKRGRDRVVLSRIQIHAGQHQGELAGDLHFFPCSSSKVLNACGSSRGETGKYW
jgi:hypothetical protein